jgi:hypothetical protein
MQSSVVSGMESLAAWRLVLDRSLQELARFLRDHELDSEVESTRLARLRERLASERVVVAFVAEFSRGKSELINAIFFAGAGRRVMPATPGRTTMCPVELFYDAKMPPSLLLLPIETRSQALAISEMRNRRDLWHEVPLDLKDPESLSRAMAAVTRTQRVTVEKAATLGLWHEEDADAKAAVDENGTLEIPAWRHALINVPHPLLERGLVVIDTPGLNAIGAEPELTLGLLPSAHAAVFLLAADTGVTKSDLAVWRDHLAPSIERFVVLNKIDTLVDPLASPEEVERQIAQQCENTARTLHLPVSRVFPISARDALAARAGHPAHHGGPADDAELIARSRLPGLEKALADELLPRRRELLSSASIEELSAVRMAATRRLGDRRRQLAEQLMELRGLRGKSGTKLKMLQQRAEADAREFEGSTARLGALRSVQLKMLGQVTATLSSERLRTEVTAMQSALGGAMAVLKAKGTFGTLCTRLREMLRKAAAQAEEMHQMLDASVQMLNAEHAFSLSVPSAPTLTGFIEEIDKLESSYGHFLSVTQAWRLSAPGFREQFRRMLLSKLRVVFENAAAEIEMWNRSVSAPMDQQLRERRAAYQRRREVLQRVEGASGELEARIAEVQAQDTRLAMHGAQMESLFFGCLQLSAPPNQTRIAAAA